MTLYAHTDGASRGNPGESGIGIIIKNENGIVLHSLAGYIGKTTNNIAEYSALLACLKRAKETGCSKLVVYSDSELMVRQLQGSYRVKDEDLRKYFRKVQRFLEKEPFEFEIHHVTRDQNREADRLAQRGIDTRKRISIN